MNRGNVGWQLANMIDNERLCAGTKTGVGPSPAIWSGCPVLPIMLDPTKGFVHFSDFLQAFPATDTNDQCYDGLKHTERTQGSISNLATVEGGVVVLNADANTVDTGITGQLAACQCAPKENTTVFMEWRCRVTVGGGQMFMGLACDSVTAIVDSDDAIEASVNLAGFFRDAGTGDTDWSVGVCNGSSSEEKDDVVEAASESLYEKFGIIIRGIGNVAGSKVEFYHEGQLVYVADDIGDLPLLLMCPTFQADSDGMDQPQLKLDWLRVAVINTKTDCRVG